jgi:hypothetical protein
MTKADDNRKVAIFDLDGCISDDRWRQHLLPKAQEGSTPGQDAYDSYHDVCDRDPVLAPGAAVLRQHIADGHIIFFATGRPFSVAEKSAAWIKSNFGISIENDFSILMRTQGDIRPAHMVKADFADFIIKNGRPVVAAYDDRQDVVDVYRSKGFNACVLNADGIAMAGPVQMTEVAMQVTGSVAHILQQAASTFMQRNAVYKDNAVNVGNVMKALFPNGVAIRSNDDHHLYHLFELIIVKLTRFANSGLTHEDSMRDIAVYAAMVEHLVAKQAHRIEVL